MIRRRLISCLRRSARDEDGAALVEFGVVLAVFLLIYFGLIDFGRLAFNYVVAEKAMHVAARIATVRPAACAGVPDFHIRGAVPTGTAAPRFGTSCNAASYVCAAQATVTCSGSASNPTAAEIWGYISGALPNSATIANLRFTYSYDANLGFLGGPYVPEVTVELQNLTFQFATPLGGLATMAGAASAGGIDADIVFPSMSVSMPGEDLASGNNG